jgi:exosortase/archaeosortase family protein
MLGNFGKVSKNKVKGITSILDVLAFIIITYAFHELWWYFSAQIKSIPAIINTAEWLAHQVFISSYWIIKHTYDASAWTEPINTIRFSNSGYITVNESCSGLKQFYQIIVLFLLFPGPWKQKLWFIPMSIIIMHGVNIFRIVVLGMVTLWLPDHWHFTHDWILRPFFYVVIFMLWVWWVERFGGFGSLLKKMEDKKA